MFFFFIFLTLASVVSVLEDREMHYASISNS